MPFCSGSGLVAEAGNICKIGLIEAFIQQIYFISIRELVLHPCGFACAPWTKEKKGLPR
jgi:hypothetical protein